MRPAPLLRALFCAALLAVLPVAAHACEDADSARADAYRQLPGGVLPIQSRYTDVDSTACRDWAAYPGTTLLAVAQWDAPASEDARGGDLDLLLLDTASRRPLAWTRIANAVSSDAMRFTGLVLDTARWQLDGDTRAFGVRMNYSGSSGPNPFEQTELQLFVRDGNAVRQVMPALAISGSNGEWDTRCAGAFSRFQRTLEMGKATGAGLAPILVRESRVDIVNTERDGGCHVSERTLPVKRWKVPASGGRYTVPDALRGL